MSSTKAAAFKKAAASKKQTPVGQIAQNNCPCKPVVIIDPGHGDIFRKYLDPGAVVKDKNGKVIETEKDIALLVSKSLKNELSSLQCIKSVHLTRNQDRTKKEKRFEWRIDEAKKVKAEIFISIHLNASVNDSATGSIILKDKGATKKSNLLAASIEKSFKLIGSRGIKKQSLGVLRRFRDIDKSKNAGVLIELGFISNCDDRTNIKLNHSFIAAEIAKGISSYIKKYHC